MVYLVMGSTYFFIKAAVQTIPPLYVLAFRFLLGGVLFALLAGLRGKLRPLPTRRELASALLIATCLFLFGVGLVTMAQRYVYSYLTALLVAAVPLIVVFFDFALLKKRITLARMLGVVLGLVGAGFLLYDGTSILTSFSPAIIMILVGIVSWSFATSIGHTLPTHKNSRVHTAIQMLYVGVVCLVAGLLIEKPLPVIASAVSLPSFLSMLYLATVGSLSFSAYLYLIKNEPSQRVATYAFVNPMVAMAFGFLLGDEKAVPFLCLGLPLTMLGLLFNFYGDRWAGLLKRAKHKRPKNKRVTQARDTSA